MPTSKPRRRNVSGEDSETSNKRDVINRALKVQLQTFPQKELFAEEIGNWERDLDPFPVEAIEWAFDNWRRNGRWFPVYGDILDLCIEYQPKEEPQYKPGCSKECLAQHGKGYNWNDIRWLYDRYFSIRDSLPRRPMTDGEINKLLDDLDKKRGKAPAWRQAA